jgi:anti-sigma-K factor RskA
MTMGEHQRPADEAERPTTQAAGQNQMHRVQPPDASGRWYRRVVFWQSIAGMAIAIALGCAAVTMEVASELSSRKANFHHRLELLSSRITRLRNEAAEAEQQLAVMRAGQLAHIRANRVLSAPDMMMLRLTPGIAGSSAHGIIAISRQEGTAIIEISGLSARAGKTDVLWWLVARGPSVKGAEFEPDADGRLSRAIQMPPRGVKIAGVSITPKPGKPASNPGGRVLLKGILPRPEVLG